MADKIYKNVNDLLASDQFKSDLFEAARQDYEKNKPSEEVIAMVRNAKKNGQNAQTALDTVSYDAGLEPGSPQFKSLADFIKSEFAEPPYLYKKGDRVTFANPRWKDQKGWQDEHEILGFYKDGEVVDENNADPNNKTYGIRLKNLKTGEELNSPASYLKLFK